MIAGFEPPPGWNGDQEKDMGYTFEEMKATMRHIICDPARKEAMDKGHSFASCGQSDEGEFCMFNTRHGNHVCIHLASQIKSASSKRSLKARYNALFGLTHGLLEYDTWIYDSEYGDEGGLADKGVLALGRAWKNLLKHTDEELGIDTEFTRPGTIAMLERLKKEVARAPDGELSEFVWT